MSELSHWHDPECPLRIEYSRAALEQIRQRAVDGLKALPRTGLAVGGLLLGERAGANVRILDSAELVCSHAFGPSFLLTPHEKAQARELIQTRQNPAVVGWYCSRTRGELQLVDSDLALYREFFPAQWQITLMLQAVLDGPLQAAFFFSNASGELTRGSVRELPGTAQLDSVDQEPAELPVYTALDFPVQNPPAQNPVNNDLEMNDLDMIDPPTKPSVTGSEETPDEPRADEPAEGGRLRWVMSWVLTAVAALAVGAAVFEVQSTWLSETPVQTAPVSPPPAQVP